MREIKFRAWDVSRLMNGKLRKKMLSNEDLLSWGDIPCPMLPNGFHDSDMGNEKQWVWMQYTGLKDKNGVEIYEGDIIKTNKGVIFKIFWASKYAKWTGKTPNIWTDKPYVGKLIYKSLPYLAERGEVIGNIYENPELLEDKHYE